jgi:hypothetical protein
LTEKAQWRTRRYAPTSGGDLQIVGHIPLILRGRLAWAHDWVDNPALTACGSWVH